MSDATERSDEPEDGPPDKLEELMAKHYKEHGPNLPWLIPIKENECTTK